MKQLKKMLGWMVIYYITLHKFSINFESIEAILLGVGFTLAFQKEGSE